MQAVNSGAGCCISTATGPLPACPVAVCNLCTLFGRLFVKTVRPMLSLRCLAVCPACPISNIGALWPNGWMDQDETWHANRPRPGTHGVRWGPSPPPLKGHSPLFSANARCGQTAGWTKMPLGMEVGLSPCDFVSDGQPAAPEKKSTPPSPNFRPMCIVAKRLDGSSCQLVWR